MKYLNVLLVMVVFVLGATSVYAGGVGTYSVGYRFGEVYKMSIKGKMMKSGEGTMLLGIESDMVTKKDVVSNPWNFSIPTDNMELIGNVSSTMGKYTVVEYVQYRKKLPNVDTAYELTSTKVVDITQNTSPNSCMVSDFTKQWDGGEMPKMSMSVKSKGQRTGRFVKLSKKGTIKSYEATIQQGSAGSIFMDMSMINEDMYDCATNFLIAGQKVKVYYIQAHLRNGMSRDTDYDIIRIDKVNR